MVEIPRIRRKQINDEITNGMKGEKIMGFDCCCEVEPNRKYENASDSVGNLIGEANKMLADLLCVLSEVEQTVYGGTGKIEERDRKMEEDARGLQMRTKMACDRILLCIEKTQKIREGLI